MKNELLMTPEAVQWLTAHGYKRSQQWLRMMVHAGKMKSEKRHGRSFFSVTELKKAVKEKRRLTVTIR